MARDISGRTGAATPWIAALGSIIAQSTVAARPDSSGLEIVALQTLATVLGGWAAFRFGKSSAAAAASEMIRPHVRSAFRRILSLHMAQLRWLASIESRREVLCDCAEGASTVELSRVLDAFAMIEAQIGEHISTYNDSLEDWRDIIPDEIAALELQLRQRDLQQEGVE